MQRFHFSVIAILILCLVFIEVLDRNYQNSLPKIELPESAHHIVGQMPIIEHFDDGNLGGKPGYPTQQIAVFSGAVASCDISYSQPIIINGGNGQNWGYISQYQGAMISGDYNYDPRQRRRNE